MTNDNNNYMDTIIQQQHETELVYSTIFSRNLGGHFINQAIHSIVVVPRWIELFIFVCGYSQNPVMVPIWAALFFYYSPKTTTTTSPSTTMLFSATFPEVFHSHNCVIMLFFLATMLVTLIGTEVCKASFQATRPERLLSNEFRSNKVRRYGTIVSSLKSKHSFPSGDSTQAMNLCLFVWSYCITTTTTTITTNPLAVFVGLFGIYLPGVCFARIFYFCHWIEDCIGGIVLSLLLHMTIIPHLSTLFLNNNYDASP